MRREIRIALGIVLATTMGVGACWLWAYAQPNFGQRPFESARVWCARCAAITAWFAAHALLAGWTLPLIYRRRPVYIGAAVCGVGVSVLGAVSAGALMLACR